MSMEMGPVVPRVLFVDDEADEWQSYLWSVFPKDNVTIQDTPDPERIVELIDRKDIQVVVLDAVYLKDRFGNPCSSNECAPQLVGAIKRATENRIRGGVPVIILSGFAEKLDTAPYKAAGADGMQQKPGRRASLEVKKAAFGLLKKKAEFLVEVSGVSDWSQKMGFVVGTSPKMIEICKNLIRWTKYWPQQRFLVTGEYGTGKGEICRAIARLFGHGDTRRPEFQVALCGGVDSRTFQIRFAGYPPDRGRMEKPGILGLLARREGLDKWRGTVVIDQFDDLAEKCHHLLNAMLDGNGFSRVDDEEKVFYPEARCKFVFTAKSYTPEQEGARRDVFDRISRCHIHLPPLSERMDVIPELYKRTIMKLLDDKHANTYLRPEVEAKLMDRHYPGNIREFENVLARAIEKGLNTPVTAEDIESRDSTDETPSDAEIACRRDQLRRLRADYESWLKRHETGILDSTAGQVESGTGREPDRCEGRSYTIRDVCPKHREYVIEQIRKAFPGSWRITSAVLGLRKTKAAEARYARARKRRSPCPAPPQTA
jgi:DNA-binding NtrC family response regulator